MGRLGINYQEVVQGIYRLQGEGKRPTVDNIRSILQTGSKSTIARHLKEWRQSEAIENPNSAANDIPEELLSLTKGLWQRLQDKADTQVQSIQKDYDEKAKSLQTELMAAMKESQTQQHDIHQLQEQLHASQKDHQTLEQDFKHLNLEHMKLSERHEAIKTRLQDNQNEKHQLHQHIKQLQANLEHYQQTEQKLKAQQTLQLDNLRIQYETKLKNLEDNLWSETSSKQALKLQCESLQQQHEDGQKQMAALEKQALALTSLQAQYKLLQETHISVEQSLKDFQSQAATCKEDSQRLQLQCENLTEQKTILQKQLSRAENKIDSLRDEKNFIMQEKANLAGQLAQMQTIMANT